MHVTKRQPVSVGEMIAESSLVPMALTQAQLAEAMGVSRKTINWNCVPIAVQSRPTWQFGGERG